MESSERKLPEKALVRDPSSSEAAIDEAIVDCKFEIEKYSKKIERKNFLF